jgi:hypothetical protein
MAAAGPRSGCPVYHVVCNERNLIIGMGIEYVRGRRGLDCNARAHGLHPCSFPYLDISFPVTTMGTKQNCSNFENQH